MVQQVGRGSPVQLWLRLCQCVSDGLRIPAKQRDFRGRRQSTTERSLQGSIRFARFFGARVLACQPSQQLRQASLVKTGQQAQHS